MPPGKRLFDVVTAAAMLVVAAPLVALVALAVRTRLGSPVIYRDRRIGLGGAPFDIYKFRTMTDERDGTGELLSDAQRLTALGRWLRRWSLDELPELWNVLRGDMSLVGPRPLPGQYLGRFSPEQMRRHDVTPGITGWAQINGRNDTTWDERFAHDLWYVDNRTAFLDARILAMTVGKVLRGEGVSAAGHVTMPEFRGDGT